MPFAFPELPTLPEFTALEPMQLQMPSMQMPDLQMQMPAMPSAGDMMAQMQASMQAQMSGQMAQMQQVHQQMPSMMSSMGAGFGGKYKKKLTKTFSILKFCFRKSYLLIRYIGKLFLIFKSKNLKQLAVEFPYPCNKP